MRAKLGLQAKMTASYVAVTAGAVLLSEIVLLVLTGLHTTTTLSAQELTDRVQATATGQAANLVAVVGKTGQLPAQGLGKGVPTPGVAQLDSGGGIAIPQTAAGWCDPEPASFAVVVSPSGTVLATSYPACFPVGGRVGLAPDSGAPAKLMQTQAQGSGVASFLHGRVVWATAPVLITPGRRYGTMYVEAPGVATVSAGFAAPASLIPAGIAVLVLSVPVGVAFGLVSTRGVTRRLRRLAASTLEVAEGRFAKPIPTSGTDEVAQLEENFNRMAARLSASVDAERRLAAANARHNERSRIARELHDSISQELFSLSVLSGGLRRSLPPGSPVLPAVETMERTAGDTMREMQALLLELRPVALAEVGLRSALDGICRAHRERLGVNVQADVEDLVLPTVVEHAILRVAQEALGNAVKHSGAQLIRLRLCSAKDSVVLEISDDGTGFDPAAAGVGAGAGLGLRAMRDRLDEISGSLDVRSKPGDGTVIRASFSRSPA